MYSDHDRGLQQEREVVAGTEPVEEFEDGSGEHYERDVEGEAGGGAGAVDRVDLVGVGGYRGADEAVLLLAVDERGRRKRETHKMGAMWVINQWKAPILAAIGNSVAIRTRGQGGN